MNDGSNQTLMLSKYTTVIPLHLMIINLKRLSGGSWSPLSLVQGRKPLIQGCLDLHLKKDRLSNSLFSNSEVDPDQPKDNIIAFNSHDSKELTLHDSSWFCRTKGIDYA